MIRAKFRCEKSTRVANSEALELRAVTIGDDKSNASWSNYTPSGALTLSITNKDAIGKLVPGQDYYLDFTPAD